MNTSQEAVGHPCGQGMLLAGAQLVPAEAPRSLPEELFSARQAPACVLASGLPAHGQHLVFGLDEF